jgi:hypothetical protein
MNTFSLSLGRVLNHAAGLIDFRKPSSWR